MKTTKQILTITIFALCAISLQAKKIDVEKAEIVARNYINSKELQTRSGITFTLVHTRTNLAVTTKHADPSGVKDDYATFYVFSKGDNEGIIIVSADDAVVPVIGYSDNGNYDADNLPPNFAYWMEYISKEISYAIDNQLSGTPEIQTKWESYLSGNIESISTRAAVSPLIQTKWNQSSPYNDLCPNGSVTGCVATSMAQVMKYYNHPASRSVTIPGYITKVEKYNIPSIGATSYNWGSMTNTYTSSSSNTQKTAVATLMYHSGASIEMDFTKEESGAFTEDAGRSLYKYFKYDHSIQLKSRQYYSNLEWENILKRELDAKRPVMYSGSNSDGGHSFICDGYNNYNEFHYNWGWGGYLDGYFVTSVLNPGKGGVGSGPGTYNESQKIIINIKPDAGGTNIPELNLWENVFTSTKTSVNKKESFYVNAPFFNGGLFTFDGVVGIILVDGSDNLVEVISMRDMSLDSYHYYSTYNMNCIVPESVKAGNYNIRAVGKQTGALSWNIISSKLPLNVANSVVTHSMKIYKDSKLSSSATTAKRGEIFTVSARFINRGVSMFSGDVGAALVDDNDRILEVIGTFRIGVSLGSEYSWTNTFDAACGVSTAISAGNYKIRAVAKPEGKDWSIIYGEGGVVEKVNITIKSETVPDNSKLILYNGTKSTFVINPNPIVQFQPLTVQFGILNDAGSASDKPFVGDIELALCRPNGEIAEVIGSYKIITYNDGYYYTYTFSSSNITSPKGTYLLTLFQKNSIGGEKKKVSNYFQFINGVEVIVNGTDVSNEIIDVQPLFVYAEHGNIYTKSNSSEIQEIRIYNLQGVEVYQSKVNDTLHKTTRNFMPGLYIVNIKVDNKIQSKKIIVK